MTILYSSRIDLTWKQSKVFGNKPQLIGGVIRLGKIGFVKESNIHREAQGVSLSWKESDAHKLAEKLPTQWPEVLGKKGSSVVLGAEAGVKLEENVRGSWEPANWWKEVMLNLCTLNSSDSRPLLGFILHFRPPCFCKQCSLWLECLLPPEEPTEWISSHPLRPWSNITFLDSLSGTMSCSIVWSWLCFVNISFNNSVMTS